PGRGDGAADQPHGADQEQRRVPDEHEPELTNPQRKRGIVCPRLRCGLVSHRPAMNVIEGTFAPPPGRFALVAARFNPLVVDGLVGGALDGLKRHRVADDAIDLVRVPGSFEIPPVAQRLAGSGKYAAVICLGAVIRGDTDHYDYVAGEAAGGVARAAMATG